LSLVIPLVFIPLTRNAIVTRPVAAHRAVVPVEVAETLLIEYAER